jgi:tripartite-type tricarboxylate transporter receptor subunit TctC
MAVGSAAQAQTAPAGAVGSWPARPIRVVIPFPPGSPQDFIVRLVGDRVGADLKQPLVVENRPGAGGNIGVEMVAKAPADGYTVLATVDTVVTINPHIYRSLSFRPDVDLVPVIYLANDAQTLVCHPGVPVKTLPEFIAWARSGTVNYASGGQGVPGHMATELFMAATGLRMNHVPYKGPGPAMQDVMAGQVSCGFLATAVVMPQVRAGKLTGIAVSQTKRSPIAPELPTVAEAGVPGYDAGFGELLMVARGTPEPIIRTLWETFGRALSQPDVRERMMAVDLEYVPGTPAEAAARLQRDSVKWKAVTDRIGLKVD